MKINMKMAVVLAASAVVLDAQARQTENNWFVSWDAVASRMYLPDDNNNEALEALKKEHDAIVSYIKEYFDEVVLDINYIEEEELFDILLYDDATFYYEEDEDEN